MERRGPIAQFPPGFHFVPTDSELICHYLRAKLDGNDLSYNAFNDVKLYDYHPADLVGTCVVYTHVFFGGVLFISVARIVLLPEKYKDYGEGRWFFFTSRDRKYPNGIRPNRTTSDGDGYWKATGTEKRIYRNRKLVGIRRSLVYYTGKACRGQKTDWIMQEYTTKSASQQPHRNSDGSMQKRGADKRKRSRSARAGRSSSPSPSNVARTGGGGGGGCSGSVPNVEGQSYRLASPGCQVGVHQRGWDDLPSICNNQFDPDINAPQYALPCGMQDCRQSAMSRRLLTAASPSEVATTTMQFYSGEAMNSGNQVYPSEAANSSLRFFSAEAIDSGPQFCAPEAINSSLRFYPEKAMNSREQLYPSEGTNSWLRFYSAQDINSAQQVYPSEEANSSVQFYPAEAMNSAQQVYATMSSEQNFYPAMSSAQQFFLSPPPMNSAEQVYPSLPPMNSAEQFYPSLMAVNSAVQVYPSGTPMNSSEQFYPSLPAMTYADQVYTSGTPMISAEHEYQSATLTNSAQQVLPLVQTSVQDNPSESARSQVTQSRPNSGLQGNSSEPTNIGSPLELWDIPDWLMQDDSIFFDGVPLELLDDQPQFPNLSEQDGGSQQALPGHGGSGLPPPTSHMHPNNDSELRTGHHHLSKQDVVSEQALPGHGGTVLPPTSDMPPNDDSKSQTGGHHHAQYNPQISTLVN
ncbi:hypothetical protein B296_00032202 [Ensete ventricosum]|uniref:NAC domain-containing protein n=1 Tax=Ensete ventricosum TaxID=4639 RepID=A0A426YMF1_ENSVE|nr:hypothetical protein B296_00032202 [Ensete ventricosum]